MLLDCNTYFIFEKQAFNGFLKVIVIQSTICFNNIITNKKERIKYALFLSIYRSKISVNFRTTGKLKGLIG